MPRESFSVRICKALYIICRVKALVFEQIGVVSLQDKPEARIQASTDAIVKVTTAGICGSDLHVLYGRDPVPAGTILGHEFIGVIQDTGSDLVTLRPGDRVLSPFTTNCGSCFYCIRDLPARCLQSEGFGFSLPGVQTEFVRVPHASSTLMKIPVHLSDEELIFLGDIFSTAYSCAEAAAIQKRDTVAIIGLGPVGLLCVLAAKLFDPAMIIAVDQVEYRKEKARSFGAISASPEGVTKLVMDYTEGRGVDAVLEAVGNPAALDLAIQLARPGSVVSIAGFHTERTYLFPILEAYSKNLTIKIGRCNARKYMRQLLPLAEQRRVPMSEIITHVIPLNEGVKGYDLFANKRDNCIKVLLKP